MKRKAATSLKARKTNQLPMGWVEVKEFSLASDKGTPPEEREDADKIIWPRKTVKCWRRGRMIVRVCRVRNAGEKETDKNTSKYITDREYTVQTCTLKEGEDAGPMIDLEGDDTITSYATDEASAVIEAKTTMRVGG